MADKATRERLKKEAAAQKLVQPVIVGPFKAVPLAEAFESGDSNVMVAIPIETKPLHTPKPKPATVGQLDKALKAKGRLPDGSCFHLSYEADKKEWRGSLVVPPNLSNSAQARCSGVTRLLTILDDMYRAKLAKEVVDGQQ